MNADATVKGRIRRDIAESVAIRKNILESEEIIDQIVKLSHICIECLDERGKIIFAGNGGSFADAQHISAELVSRLKVDRQPIASMVLGANYSALTAVANDYGYEYTFARELCGIAEARDVFIPLSTSGRSKNIIKAVELGLAKGMKIFAFTGGGDANSLRNVCQSINVPSEDTAQIQEVHMMIGHILCGLIESEIARRGDTTYNLS